ncbi:hypothetical protein WNJ37_07205 [Klebsiella pneumoniae]|uniref:hypothetical protein n=1 Tax=Klebsiella pneumoniae complex TaxID=3390273 RepID=UPI000813CDD8|nr:MULTISPECIES: hypothetical protein [Klebsiella]HBQ6008198.1 hypothetical protein [Klebsiella pneumoniae subsp. pneumoniae]EKW2510264.1 hypothetical protein [Klebsiella pneumoniae]ELI7103510.1 hypothetical protein [Klebsiella pneumoniae]ELJ2020773.1 hypothetical protein [Klebsiella pneumoniae]ELN3936589.1 hypothetical protein [Klebsiella pneumoniae]
MTKITERGMIFNAEMVRALLSGRKTQTRRIMKPQPEPCPRGGHWWPSNVFKTMLHVEDEMQNGKGGWGGLVGDACPFGAVGDRIWVRETWGVVSHAFSDDGLMIDWVPDRPATAIHEMPFGNGYYSGYAIYAADGDFTWGDDDGYEDGCSCWKPSIHMPRAASRILLEITDVRVERLRSMSQDDARAEGVIAASGPMEAGLAFRELWDSIYGEESWKANPWVWVIKFKRIEELTA